ncbi:DUF945 family protein [Desulfurivibrio dismutans]|uniref:DUF945 family protein n=1 Tax=Desulfurivibrio dismutans TaxID=1398908 RepID=UPI0023DA47E6|nr:DUF945 family protein [Desulfurivibrio alkaliphilus]MDF1614452.1 DUF945 family protein [Desulfurivibrio alkaliphilus]
MPDRNRKSLLLRWLPPAAGIVLLAGGAATFFIGLKTEEHFTRSIARLNDQHQIHLELVSYQRGLFSSRAISRLHPEPSPSPPGSATLKEPPQEIVHQLWHGPLPRAGLHQPRRFSLRPLLAVVKSRLLVPGSEPEERLCARTAITFGGQAEVWFQLAAGQRREPALAGMTLTWRELEGRLVFPLDLGDMEGKLHAPGLALTKHETAGTDQHILEMHGLQLCFSYQQQRDDRGGVTLQATQQLEFTALATTGEQHGPMQMTLHWRNLDRQAAGEMFNLTPWWRRLLLGPNGREIPPATAQSLVETLARLLAKSPELEIDQLRLTTPHGDAQGRLQLTYRQRDDARPFHPIMLLSGLQLAVEAAAPAPLLASLLKDYQYWRKSPELGADESITAADEEEFSASDPLADLRQRGYLAADPERDEVSLKLHYQAGELTINGQPAPLQALRYLLR